MQRSVMATRSALKTFVQIHECMTTHLGRLTDAHFHLNNRNAADGHQHKLHTLTEVEKSHDRHTAVSEA